MSSSLERQWEVSISTFENEMRFLFSDWRILFNTSESRFCGLDPESAKDFQDLDPFFFHLQTAGLWVMGSVVASFIVLLPGSLTARTLNLKIYPRKVFFQLSSFIGYVKLWGCMVFFLGVSCGGAFKKLAWTEPVPLVRPFWRVFQERFWPSLVLHSSPKLFDFAAFLCSCHYQSTYSLDVLARKIRTNNKELWTPMFPYCI